MTFRHHAASDVGRIRRENQDAYFADPVHGIFAVADGIGGLPGGAAAARSAVDALARRVKALQPGKRLALPETFAEMNEAVIAHGRRIREEFNTGTTFTLAQILGDEVFFGHVGDSSLHLVRPDGLVKLTLDHTVADDREYRDLYADNPEIAAMVKNVLTRCLGAEREPRIDIGSYALRANDRLVLGTDGILKGVWIDEIAEWVREAGTPAEAVETIVQAALKRGGYDNITTIVVFVES